MQQMEKSIKKITEVKVWIWGFNRLDIVQENTRSVDLFLVFSNRIFLKASQKKLLILGMKREKG